MSKSIVLVLALFHGGISYAKNSDSKDVFVEEALDSTNIENEKTWTEMLYIAEPTNYLESTILGLKLGLVLIPISVLSSYSDSRTPKELIINVCIEVLSIPFYVNFLYGLAQIGDYVASLKVSPKS